MQNDKWEEELQSIREILHSTELEETHKWGTSVFTYKNKNLIGLGGFKNHFAITFFEGVFLQDKHKKLAPAQETTKAMRQWRMESKADIDAKIIKEYARECIHNVDNGRVYKTERMKGTTDMPTAPPLQEELSKNKTLLKAFAALSPGKQKEFHAYINEAKQEKTKLSRIEKIKPIIMAGKGLHDQYKNC